MNRFFPSLFSLSMAAALLSGCSDMAPLSKAVLPTHTPQPAAVPEWPPNYEGRKPWNRNPETPKDNHAYKVKGQRIDVIGADGPLFVDNVGGQLIDWPKPKLALLLSGTMQGYIEPCGCAGLENMKGGLSRRHTLIEELKQEGWPLVLLDQGELTHRVGPQATIKYQRTIDGLRTMGYRTIGLGTSDLRLMASDLLATLPGDGATHYVSANVGLMGMDNDFTAPFRVIEEGGMKIGVTSVSLPPKDQPLQNADVAIVSPTEGLKKVVPQLVAKKCDQLVLLVAPCVTGQGTLEDGVTRKAAEELARQFPQFNIMVIATDEAPPSKDLKSVTGSPTKLVELSHKSMYVGVVAFFDNQARPMRYQRVPLDARFGASTDMKQLLVNYQDQLREEGFERLGVLPRQHPQRAKFVGSQACADCHTKAFAIWEKTPHAHAMDTLDKVSPPRMHDPECLSCHVTGWDAKAYVPFLSGFESRKKTPQLAGNGCENCHGPGSAHVAAENDGADKAVLKQLREQMRLTIAEAKNIDSPRGCARCHDLDNSPDYIKKGFEHYWPQVEHKGKD